MKLDDVLRLTGKTHKGKNRTSTAEWGRDWIVWRVNEDHQSVGIVSLQDDLEVERSSLPESFRWVERTEDPDFEIEVVEG